MKSKSRNLKDPATVLNLAAHELRNPLATILGFAELIKENPRTLDKLETYVGYIWEKAKKMQGLLDGILDISRYELGKPIHIETAPLEVAQLIQTLAQELGSSYIESHWTLDLDPTQLLIDKKRLRTVLTTVLENSLHFSSQPPQIQVTGRKMKSRYLISIADQGPGISQDNLPHVTEAFFAADGETGAGKGSGLGLTLAKVYTELMGGVMDITSEPGQGTLVTLRFTV